MRLGALEAGGTKMVASIGNEDGQLFDRISVPTLMPEETIPELVAYFRSHNVEAVGIASFGPLDLDKDSPTYGYVTTTPKPGWGNYPLLQAFRDELNVPCGFDTDVNGAALAEFEMGAGKGLSSCAYVTVGTGIGGGIVVNHKMVHGMLHPELGHIILRAHPDDPMPNGTCPYHVGCLEGLAKGPAFDDRWGISSKDLPKDHIGWALEAYYLAQMCSTLILSMSIEKIVLGGGVMQQKFLFPMIHKQVLQILNGYVATEQVLKHIDQMIVEPALGVNSGVTGALLLAAQALRDAR